MNHIREFRRHIRLDHDRAISQAIDSASLADDIGPAASDGLIGRRGVRLSGGRGQRLALA
jgi:ABC-type transport system involved in cytochrome bd biosynthesis fused ATPase/permease subunit